MIHKDNFRRRPIPNTNGMMRDGKCRRVIGQFAGFAGRVCGKPFTGPPSRKFCDEHSPTIQYRGKG